jgi:hypothetical protein
LYTRKLFFWLCSSSDCISNSETRTKYNTWHTLTSLRLNSYWAAVVTGKLTLEPSRLVVFRNILRITESCLMSRAKEHNDLMMLKTLNKPYFLASTVYHSECIRRVLLHDCWSSSFRTRRLKL